MYCYGKTCFRYLIGILNISVLLYTKFAVAYLVKGQLLHAIESWVRFLILQEGAVTLML